MQSDLTPDAGERRPLRVLMSADAVGGVWPYALDLARGLAARDIETVLAVLGPPAAPDQREEACAVDGLELIETGLPLEWTVEAPELAEEAGTRFALIVGETKPDVVHLNSPALAFHVENVPAVAVCHSCVATWWSAVHIGPLPQEFVWRTRLAARGLQAAAAVIAPSAAFAEQTARTYGMANPPHVVRNGRHPLAPPADPAPTELTAFAFTAGRFWDEGKNVAVIDMAAARLATPIFAAGPLAGPNGTSRSLVHAHSLGRLNRKDMSRWLAAAPVFVSMSLYEPFGLAVLEAAQAGCALILSDIPTFRELWDGAAVFVDARDDATLAAEIARALADTAHGDALRAAARARAACYDVDTMASGVARIYRAVLAARLDPLVPDPLPLGELPGEAAG